MGLGARIRKLRINNGLSVRQLAEQLGLSASFIYQLEQEKASPSFSTLKSIASVLQTSISLLIEDELPEEWIIVRRSNRKRLVTGNDDLHFNLLTFLGQREKKMQPMVFELEAGGENNEINFSHEREDFIFILKGRVEISVAKSKFVLEEGDAGYFIFDSPTAIKNTGREKAEGIWIVCPPGI